MIKISFCTACMNRLIHLRETLPVNIKDNIKYPSLEFIILDYNSGDGMEKWARSHLAHYIESGIVKYYKNQDPEFFKMSHSKNMSLKLATGDILCLLDADNYAGPGYASWINDIFAGNSKKSVITTLRHDKIPYRDQGGKLGFHKDFFHAVQGFDESFIGYGIEDVDLVNRMEKQGGRRVFIEENKFLRYIQHSDQERVKNFQLINRLEGLYVELSSSMNSRNKVLYLLKDNSFFSVTYEFDRTMSGNPVLSHSGWSIAENGRKKGNFKRQNKGLLLVFEDESTEFCKDQGQGILAVQASGGKTYWKKISETEDIYYASVKAFGECNNRLAYIENDKSNGLVNKHGWGQGTVYLNFDTKTPIQVS